MFTLPMDFIRFLPSFCFSNSFSFSRNITTVTLGGHVLTQGADILAGDDLATDRGLDGDLVKLGRNDLLELRGEGAAAGFRLVAVDDAGEGVDAVRRSRACRV